MIYSLKRIIHNLKKHLLVYLLFVGLFAVGILILCSTLNVLISLQKDLKKQQEEMAAENAIELISNSYYEGPEENFMGAAPDSLKQGMAVSYDVYLKLAEKYKEEFTFQYAVETTMIHAGVFKTEDESFIDLPGKVNVWFVNDELFQAYFGMPMEQDTIYAGENAYETLQQMKEWVAHPEDYKVYYSDDNVLWVENGEYTVAHKDTFKLAAMPSSEKTQIKPSEPDRYLYEAPEEDVYYRPDLVDCIFIPMSEFPAFEEFYDSLDWEEIGWHRQFFSNLLKAQSLSPEYKTESISEMIAFLTKESHLKECDMAVEFTLNEKQLEQQERAEVIRQGMNNYLIMAVSVLLIVMLGTTGLFLIFLYRRKKQMAVAIAYGSTKQRLFFELFAEIFIITGVGAALGLWGLRFTAEFFQSFYMEAVFQISCVLIAFAIAALTALVTAALAFLGVGEIAPAKILKEL